MKKSHFNKGRYMRDATIDLTKIPQECLLELADFFELLLEHIKEIIIRNSCDGSDFGPICDPIARTMRNTDIALKKAHACKKRKCNKVIAAPSKQCCPTRRVDIKKYATKKKSTKSK